MRESWKRWSHIYIYIHLNVHIFLSTKRGWQRAWVPAFGVYCLRIGVSFLEHLKTWSWGLVLFGEHTWGCSFLNSDLCWSGYHSTQAWRKRRTLATRDVCIYIYISSWWFHIFCYFHPDAWEKWSNLTSICFNWVLQPPTTYIYIYIYICIYTSGIYRFLWRNTRI